MVIGGVLALCAVATIYIGHLLEQAMFRYPPAPVMHHIPGRDDREIVDRLVERCGCVAHPYEDDEQTELGI